MSPFRAPLLLERLAIGEEAGVGWHERGTVEAIQIPFKNLYYQFNFYFNFTIKDRKHRALEVQIPFKYFSLFSSKIFVINLTFI